MTVRRPKVPWSVGDKFLMIVLGLILPLGLGLVLWFRALDRNPDVSVPTPALPMPNALDYYKAAQEAMIDRGKVEHALFPLTSRGGYSGGQAPADHVYSLAQKAALVNENRKTIQTLHQGFRFPYHETPLRSFTATFPHLQKFRELARLLSLQAQTDAEQGNWNGAMTADLDAIQLGETMPRGGTIISMLVGDACQSIGRKQAWSAAEHLNSAQAKAAAQRLARIRLSHVPYGDTLQEEKWSGQASLLEVMRRLDWSGALATYIFPIPYGSTAGNNSLGQWAIATRIRLTGKRKILANYSNAIDQQIADARQPYATRSSVPAPGLDPVNEILVPMFGNTRFNEVYADTENALLVTTLALRAYKLGHGAYPPNLTALVPDYLQTVPNDPFALSGPILYKRTGAKYLLYSVGPDGKDDGGAAIFDKTLPAPTNPGGYERRRLVQENSQGDIVAGINP